MNGYQYRCVASNSCPSSVTSATATLTISTGCIPILITSHPTPQFITAPNAAVFSVTVTGTSPLYQWQYLPSGGITWFNLTNSGNTTWTTGNNTSILTISNTSGLNGYSYHCIVSNSCTSPIISGPGELFSIVGQYTVSTQLPYKVIPFPNPYTLAAGHFKSSK